MDINWEFDKEPGVIDETLIYNAVISQGPKGDEGKIFKEQGVKYEEVEHLRLEFYDILKIDHLWVMTGLTSLQLSNNIIEVIENLDCLVNLCKLDLSFNSIFKIQNLDKLVNLKIISLFENKISTLENMEALKKLQVFSIGNNKLHDTKDIIYLRQFKKLQSLNVAGNPFCQEENFYSFIYAFLPNLVYYEYKMISDEQKVQARKLYESGLVLLEENENLRRKEELAALKAQEQEEMNKEAFVEYLGGDQLFLAMFHNDPEGNTILEIGDEALETYKEYMKNFGAVTRELHAYALEQHEVRKAELAEYERNVEEAKNDVFKESRELLEEFLQQKKQMLGKLRKMVDTDEEETDMTQLSMKIQEINGTFQKLCLQTWHTLMKKELNLFEAMERVNTELERSLTQLVIELVEAAQAKFTQLRALQGAYHEAIDEITGKYITRVTLLLATNKKAAAHISPELLAIMADRETLANAICASHDSHQLVIDTREDQLVSSAKKWLRQYVDNLVNDEINRNRNQIIEINHFLDRQREELNAITSSGLQALPTEIQDALQIG